MVDPADGGSKAAERFEEISADEARIEELLGALTLEEKVTASAARTAGTSRGSSASASPRSR